VYAGPGDSLYVEFNPQNADKSPLFVMDGGPRNFGSFGSLGGLLLDNSTRPYWRFFFSAGKEIWYDQSQLGMFATKPLKLHALVNSHAHEDHIEGMIDMVKNLSHLFLTWRRASLHPASIRLRRVNISPLCGKVFVKTMGRG